MDTVIFIDDERGIRDSISMILPRYGFAVVTAATAAEGLALIKKNAETISVVVTDLMLPGGVDGMDILDRVKEIDSTIPVIMITAFGNIETAVLAMKKGAFTFITKPFEYKVLIQQINKALETASLKVENRRLQGELKEIRNSQYQMIYESKKMQAIIDAALVVAPTDETVLITGESGTGKELLARFILENSSCAHKPFIVLNAAAIPESLLESELFGYVKGAFTGADKSTTGYIGAAEGGTLFIDEIGEMPLSLQSRLLRFLQEKEYMRVGSSKAINANVRVIAATNKNLLQECENGHFREDLFYRLSVFPLHIPALRERDEDIGALAKHFVMRVSARYKRPEIELSDHFIASLQGRRWKGNIRELENFIARFVLTGGQQDSQQDGGQPPSSLPSSHIISFEIGKMPLKDMEDYIITETLKSVDGNKKLAADLLKVSQRTIYRKITGEEI
ncbi:sigma-54-dependent Fis family transcriptional regulator [bacterium]|nr:sigma-54-dependent Fis family transcriptional regulator [bacterium]